MLRNRLALVVSLLALQLQVAAGAQQKYVLTDLGPRFDLAGNYQQIAINASGVVTGTTLEAIGGDTAWVWIPSSPNASTGALSLLPVPSGTSTSWAEGINDFGQIVGWRTYPNGTYKFKGKTYVTTASVAVEWQLQPNGTYVSTDLPAGIGPAAVAINNSGEIVGRTALLTRNTIYPLPGFVAQSINNSGQVAGWFSPTTSTGYLWTPSSPNGTSGSYVTFSFAAAQVNSPINLSPAQVVGAPFQWGDIAAVFSSSTQVVTTMLSSPPSPNSEIVTGNSINNLNPAQVVGYTSLGGAYLWDSVNGVQYLNDSTRFTIVDGAGLPVTGWNFAWASRINDSGQIVGWGVNPSGADRTFLLTP